MKATHTPVCGYSADTEILTRSGWITLDQLTYLDEVASRTPDGEFRWECPARIAWHRHEGPMLHFRSQVYDLIVAPEHPMPTYGCTQPRIPAARPARWFIGGHSRAKYWRMPTTSQWKGSAPETIVIPGIVPRRGQHHPARRLEIPAATWMRFLGWFISEGSLNSAFHLRNAVTISQLRDDYKPDIRQVLQDMRVSFRESAKGFEFNHGPLAAWLRTAAYDGAGHRSWNKRIPRSVRDYPAGHLAQMFDSLMRGDGHVEKNGFRRYLTTSLGLAGDVEEILQKMGTQGWHGIIDCRAAAGPGGYEVKARRLQYRVSARPGDESCVPVPVEVPYTGLTCHPQVPGHAVHVRRNGRTAWCG